MIELLFACAIVCRGDVCVMEPDLAPAVPAEYVAVAGPQRSIVVKRTYATQFGSNHPLATAPIRIPLKGAKFAAKVALPPYPRFRQVLENRWFPGKKIIQAIRCK